MYPYRIECESSAKPLINVGILNHILGLCHHRTLTYMEVQVIVVTRAYTENAAKSLYSGRDLYQDTLD